MKKLFACIALLGAPIASLMGMTAFRSRAATIAQASKLAADRWAAQQLSPIAEGLEASVQRAQQAHASLFAPQERAALSVPTATPTRSLLPVVRGPEQTYLQQQLGPSFPQEALPYRAQANDILARQKNLFGQEDPWLREIVDEYLYYINKYGQAVPHLSKNFVTAGKQASSLAMAEASATHAAHAAESANRWAGYDALNDIRNLGQAQRANLPHVDPVAAARTSAATATQLRPCRL